MTLNRSWQLVRRWDRIIGLHRSIHINLRFVLAVFYRNRMARFLSRFYPRAANRCQHTAGKGEANCLSQPIEQVLSQLQNLCSSFIIAKSADREFQCSSVISPLLARCAVLPFCARLERDKTHVCTGPIHQSMSKGVSQ